MKIALTHTGSIGKHNNYLHWLQSADPAIEIITLSADKDNLHELKNCDGLVLSGGLDIHPELYGKDKSYKNAPEKFNRKRDHFETAVFNQSQLDGIPVLAICRGMQLVNCINGGNLQQDLGKQGNKIHRAQDLVDKAHGLTIEKETILYDIVNAERTVINSAHHQAIRKVGKGLKINCLADDGTVEGLERIDPENKPFLLCIQWHPERMYKFQLEGSAVSEKIRDRFIEAIKKSGTK